MTNQEAVQKAYQWAMRIGSDKRSPLMHLYAAKLVQKAVEENNQYDQAHAVIVELIREWTRSRKPGLVKPVELLTSMMELSDEPLLEFQA